MAFIPKSEIGDQEILYRAIHPCFWNDEENRPSSALFKDDKGVSVDRDGERKEIEISSKILDSRKNYGLGNINAGETRIIGTYIKPDSLPENDYHALIQSSETKIKLSNGIARKLSKMINILLLPTSD